MFRETNSRFTLINIKDKTKVFLCFLLKSTMILFIILQFLLTITICNAQSENGLLVSKSRQNESESQDMRIYGGSSAANFTGNSKIEIPLYKIELRGLSIPIALKYNNSGIKVEQRASFVGLGWNLDAGGTIIRMLRGFPDDVWKNQQPFANQIGYLLDRGRVINDFTDLNTSSENISKQLGTISGTMIKVGENNWQGTNALNPGKNTDTEPDLFYFNFTNNSGSFVFGKDQKIKFLAYHPFKTDYVLSEEGDPSWTMLDGSPFMSKGIMSFTIIDQNGNKFSFSDLEKTKFRSKGRRIRTNCDIDRDAQNFESYLPLTTAWHLTKVESFQGEVVNYFYSDVTMYHWQIQESERNSLGPDVFEPGKLQGITYIDNQIVVKRLSRIETPYEEIEFLYNLNREDIYNTQALTSLNIKSKGVFKKSISFNYNYFNSANPKPSDPGTDRENIYKRLKLTSITLDSLVGIKDSPRFSFLYDELYPLPRMNSFEQDFWGYYNKNTNATSLIPTVYVRPDLIGPDRFSVLNLDKPLQPSSYIIKKNDRSVNTSFITTGILSKITYPDGGTTTYDYESNDFVYKEKKYFGGGIRVRQITDYDGISHENDMIRSYSYVQPDSKVNSSGLIFDLPIFAYLENNCANDFSGTGYDSQIPPNYDKSSYNYFYYNTTLVANPMHINGLGDEIVVGYSNVIEKTEGRGHIQFKFSVPVKSGDLTNEIDGQYQVPSIKYTLTWRPQGFSPDQGPDFAGTDLSLNSYPFIPNSNVDWGRGLVLERTEFDQDFKPQKKVQYKYSVIGGDKSPEVIEGLYFQNGNNYNIKDTKLQNTFTGYSQALVYYSKYKIITGQRKLIQTEEVTDIFSSGNLITSSIFSYKNGTFLSSRTSTNSDGKISKVSYRYPFDIMTPTISVNAMNPISFLIHKNNVAVPLESINSIFKNNKEYVVGAKFLEFGSTTYNTVSPVSEYGFFSAVPVPIENYRMADVYFEDGYEVLSMDPHFTREKLFSKYDDRSNLLEMSDKSGSYKSFIYGYNKMYPIASAFNTNYKNIFHENFEETLGNSNLTYSGKRSYSGNYIKTLIGLDNGTYHLTYRNYVMGRWLLIRNKVTVSSNTYVINLTGQLDDICFYPLNSKIETTTYDPFVGITSKTNINGETEFYSYDRFRRLKTVEDNQRNVVKVIEYHHRSN